MAGKRVYKLHEVMAMLEDNPDSVPESGPGKKEGLGQFIRTPLNTALLVGQRLELVCQSDGYFTIREWKSQRSGIASSPIYGNWRQPRIEDKRFGVDIDNDSALVIHLNSTELDDAGIYSCHIHAGTHQPRHCSAHVIVFETEPFCEDSISTDYNVILEEGDVVWMRCSVNFRGNLTPTMEWRQLGGPGDIDEHYRIVAEMAKTTVIPDTRISSTLSIVLKSNYNATFFTCKTYFQWDNTSPTKSTATDAPDYSYTWNSYVIIISASPLSQRETATVSSLEYLWIVVLPICAGVVIISICIVNMRKFKSGSAEHEQAEDTSIDSNPDYQNVTTDACVTIDRSQKATYMELASVAQTSLPVYTSINIAGRMLTMPDNPSSDYEDMADL